MAPKKKAPAKKETKGSALKALVNAFKGKKAQAPVKKPSVKVVAKNAPKKEAPKKEAVKKEALKKPLKKEVLVKVKAPAPVKPEKVEKPAKVLKGKAAKVEAAPVIEEEAMPAARPEKKLTARQMAKAAAAAAAQAAIDAACREIACESASLILGYCRLHYIKNWKKIKRKEIILREKKLNQYIEELVAKYPDKYIEAIRSDLSNEKDFAKVISDLDIDEGNDEFEADTENVEIVDSIRRDFEDDGDF